jgi:eukaryotic-like serine/threonine-protein kinase
MRSNTCSKPSTEPADPATRRLKHLLALAIRPRRFGDYELLARIGSGASSIVHRARRRSDGAVVALKILRKSIREGPGRWRYPTPEDQRDFLGAATLAKSLEHRHIPRVLEVDSHRGRPFMAMTLIEGKSLKQVLRQGPRSSPQAARWTLAIARAVQHTHEQGMVHRDLKPANVMIDEHDQPHVTDFGLARRLDQPTRLAGSRAYMPPEQTAPEAPREAQLPSTSGDLYSLGVIFYQLLTGKPPPVSMDATGSWQHDEPELTPGVGASFAWICFKCLDRDPARRYTSAKALADDLENAIAGGATTAPVPPLPTRVRWWVRRHPAGAAGVLAAVAALLGLGAFATWRAEMREQEKVLETNAFIASAHAGAVLAQLHAFADRVGAIAHHPVVTTVLQEGETVDPAPRELATFARGFDNFGVMTAEGRVLAQSPTPPGYVFERRFDFRDYFRGARELARGGRGGVFVSPAYHSESNNALRFCLASPVLSREGRQLGLVLAQFDTGGAFGDVPMQEDLAGRGQIVTALLAPRGRDRHTPPDAPLPADFTFLVHPGLSHGAEHALRAPSGAQLRAAFGPSAPPGEQLALQYAQPLKVSDYRDPIPGFAGSWLAAFAPVGRTGFVVLVETPRAAGVLDRRLALAAALFAAAALALAIPAVISRRRRRIAPRPRW